MGPVPCAGAGVIVSPLRKPPTQNERVLAFISAYPGCTTMEIQRGMDPWCSNPRARISDLRREGREEGWTIEPRTRLDGHVGFWYVVRKPTEPEQLRLDVA